MKLYSSLLGYSLLLCIHTPILCVSKAHDHDKVFETLSLITFLVFSLVQYFRLHRHATSASVEEAHCISSSKVCHGIYLPIAICQFSMDLSRMLDFFATGMLSVPLIRKKMMALDIVEVSLHCKYLNLGRFADPLLEYSTHSHW